MKQKAQYDIRPEDVVIVTDSGKDFIILRANFRQIEVEDMSIDEKQPSMKTVWECDENQIVLPHGILDLDDVQSNSGRYIDYVYIDPKSRTPEMRIVDLETENADLKVQVKEAQDALVELAEIITEGM